MSIHCPLKKFQFSHKTTKLCHHMDGLEITRSSLFLAGLQRAAPIIILLFKVPIFSSIGTTEIPKKNSSISFVVQK